MLDILHGEFNVVEILLGLTALLLVCLFIMVVANCCMQCSYEEDDHDEWIDEQIYHDKGYYDEICALLYRYRQVELGQLEHEQEAERKKQAYEYADGSRTNTQTAASANASITNEKIVRLKAELEQYRINHNIRLKADDVNNDGRRRTWGGLQDDGVFVPVALPEKSNAEVQTSVTLERKQFLKNVETVV